MMRAWLVASLAVGASMLVCAASLPASNSQDAIFVVNSGYITIYPLDAKGDVAPVATIDGAATGLSSPCGIAVDASGKIYVLNMFGGQSNRPSVVVFARGSRGNATPIAKIAGDDTEMASVKAIAVDGDGNIYVSNEQGPVPDTSHLGRAGVTVYPAGSNGNVKPMATIRGRAVDMTKPCADPCGNDTGIQNPFGIAVDSHGNLYVADPSGEYGPSVLIFAHGSTGDARPSTSIGGPHTELTGPCAIAVDSRGDIYIAEHAAYGRRRVVVFRAGSSGDAAPMTIMERDTRVSYGIALDDGGNIYTTASGNEMGDSSSVEVYAQGTPRPLGIITGDATALFNAGGIAVGPYPTSEK